MGYFEWDSHAGISLETKRRRKCRVLCSGNRDKPQWLVDCASLVGYLPVWLKKESSCNKTKTCLINIQFNYTQFVTWLRLIKHQNDVSVGNDDARDGEWLELMFTFKWHKRMLTRIGRLWTTSNIKINTDFNIVVHFGVRKSIIVSTCVIPLTYKHTHPPHKP